MHFPSLARAGSKFFKTMHTIQIFEHVEDRPMSVLQFQCCKLRSPLTLSTPKLLVFRRSTSHGHVVDVTADAKHLLYFVLATLSYRIKCIAVMEIVFHCVSLLKNRVVCNSPKWRISFIFQNAPLRQFLRNCRQTKNVSRLIFTGHL